MRDITHQEVENIAKLWEPVHIIDLDNRVLIGSVPRDVVSPNHLYSFSTKNRALLSEMFTQAFKSGCQHVGFISPDYLYDTMYSAALAVAENEGGDWQVSPLVREEYQDLVEEAQLKMLAEVATKERDAEIEESLALMEKQWCDAIGLDTKTILEFYAFDADLVENFAQDYNKALEESRKNQ